MFFSEIGFARNGFLIIIHATHETQTNHSDRWISFNLTTKKFVWYIFPSKSSIFIALRLNASSDFRSRESNVKRMSHVYIVHVRATLLAFATLWNNLWRSRWHRFPRPWRVYARVRRLKIFTRSIFRTCREYIRF